MTMASEHPRANLQPLTLHIPEPKFRPGDAVDFAEVDVPPAGEDMTFDFGTLVAHAAKTRKLGAGTIVGSGPVSNRGPDGGPGKSIAEGGVGYSCLAEVRTIETITGGKPVTPFLKKGDVVRIWAEDDKRHPIFGVIEQTVGG